ncbi:hypothetical protein MPSEU_000660500 [Mayamaea pseudoterrestris]|nr:hypothetical protein MPSEU_000660500 [Mayamaea pseudoterrestris]
MPRLASHKPRFTMMVEPQQDSEDDDLYDLLEQSYQSPVYRDYYDDLTVDGLREKHELFWLWTTVAAALVLLAFTFEELLREYLTDLWTTFWNTILDAAESLSDFALMNYAAQAIRTVRFRRRQLTDVMPELEPLPAKARLDLQPQQDSRNLHHDPDDVEPAFIDECDFPISWLVYHPVLGVVTKTIADEYRSDVKSSDLSSDDETQSKRDNAGMATEKDDNDSMSDTCQPPDTFDHSVTTLKHTNPLPNGSPCTIIHANDGSNDPFAIQVPKPPPVTVAVNGG